MVIDEDKRYLGRINIAHLLVHDKADDVARRGASGT